MVLTRRERQRASTFEEIKQTARRLMAQQGGAGISLRAIASEMGMVPSALYRYYASRDELLTALIVDSFHAQAAAMQAAYDAQQNAPPKVRLLAIGHAFRTWALENRTEFQLIGGTPIPGYSAPADVTAPAARLGFVPLLRTLGEYVDSGEVALMTKPPVHLLEPFSIAASSLGFPERPELMYACYTLWMHVHGMVALEVFGHLDIFGDDLTVLYQQQMLDLLGSLLR